MSDVNVQLNDTPTAQLIKDASKEVAVTDSSGRVITLKKPGVLAQFRLIEAVGPETAQNQVYMSMVLPLIFVTSIDGEPEPFPTKKSQVEALIQRLGDEGVACVMRAMGEHFGAVNPDAQRDQLKK